MDENIESDNQLGLTASTEISEQDICGLTSKIFSFPVNPNEHNEIKVLEIKPGQTPTEILSIAIEAPMENVQIDLSKHSDGYYEVQWIGIPAQTAKNLCRQ